MPPYVIAALETPVPWPTTETRVACRGHELLLRPETTDLLPTVVLDLKGSLAEPEGFSLMNAFLSSLSWIWRRPVNGSVSCQGIPLGFRKGMAQEIAPSFREEYLPDPPDPDGRLALGLYREAVGVNSPAYACLGYFRVLNIRLKGDKALIAWMEAAIPRVTESEAVRRLPDLQARAAETGRTPGEYLHGLRRSAIAHADPNDPLNPDERGDYRLLRMDEPMIRALAELFIETDLGIPSERSAWRNRMGLPP